MSKAIQVFEFNGAQVRTAGTLEAPLVCAADVCAALSIANVQQALEPLDQDEIVVLGAAENGSQRVLYSGPNANVYLTESGLYTLILTSRKPQAKAFKRWVTGEVLPEIRKRGYYSALEAAIAKSTEQLLAEHFPHLPGKAKPMFSELIQALLRKFGVCPTSSVKVRVEGLRRAPWAPLLASLVYGWAIRIDGQQQHRRRMNPNRTSGTPDHSMFSDVAAESVRDVVRTGIHFVKVSGSWEDWKWKMELAFGTKALQMPILVPLLDAGSPDAAE